MCLLHLSRSDFVHWPFDLRLASCRGSFHQNKEFKRSYANLLNYRTVVVGIAAENWYSVFVFKSFIALPAISKSMLYRLLCSWRILEIAPKFWECVQVGSSRDSRKGKAPKRRTIGQKLKEAPQSQLRIQRQLKSKSSMKINTEVEVYFWAPHIPDNRQIKKSYLLL